VVDISGTTIVWQGNTIENEQFLEQYYQTYTCLQNMGAIANSQPPYIIITEGYPVCNGEKKLGCSKFSNNTIYIMETALSWLRHEFVHIITQRGDEAHGTAIFSCAS
jgi:hypothetical protein